MPTVEELSTKLVAELDANELLSFVPIDPRSLPWRYSTLKCMAQSPAHYYQACQKAQDDRLCLRIGAGTHAILFGQPHAKWPGRRAGKAWTDFEAEHAAVPILNAREYAQAQGIADAIRRNADAVRYLLLDTRVEQRVDWKYLGRDFRSTPDAFGRYHVTELKTTKCAEPVRFVRDGGWRAYHVQLATYREALIEKGLSTASEAVIVAVESLPPHPVTVFKVSDDTLERGARTLRLWAEQALACEAAGEYPGYAQTIQPFDIGDADDHFTIVANGEEIDL